MSLRKYIPLLLSAGLLFCFFYFRLYRFLSLESLAHHHSLLLQWKEENYFLAAFLYILLYTAAVSASFPGAIFFSLAGGFLFGPFPGALFVVFSATVGSTLLFLAVKLALADWVRQHSEKWLRKLELGFQKNAFNYLLSLRLIPVFPFFVVTIVSGLLGLPLRTFVIATFFGIIPASLIYTSIGQNLGALLAQQKPLIEVLLQPRFILPLCALAALALLPIIYQHFKRK